MQHKPLIKFSGRVTVDGQPPKKECKLLVIFTDPAHLDENGKGILPKYYEGCDNDGSSTSPPMTKGMEFRLGKYVVTFVEEYTRKSSLPKPAKGVVKSPVATRSATGPSMRFLGPDELKGLYSDPEQHAKQPAFLLDLHEGSTTTHDFALVVGDKKGVKPSRHAVQTLVLRPRGGRLEGDGEFFGRSSRVPAGPKPVVSPISFFTHTIARCSWRQSSRVARSSAWHSLSQREWPGPPAGPIPAPLPNLVPKWDQCYCSISHGQPVAGRRNCLSGRQTGSLDKFKAMPVHQLVNVREPRSLLNHSAVRDCGSMSASVRKASVRRPLGINAV